jgi:hypothetical protein
LDSKEGNFSCCVLPLPFSFPFLSFLLDSNCVVLVLELLRLW